MKTIIRKTAKPIATLLLAVCMAAAIAPVSLHAEDTPVDTGSTTATVTFTAGILSLQSVPTISFGTNTISNTLTYNAAADSDIIVSDLRGNGEGWRVTVALSAFNDGANSSLPGASIGVTGAAVTGEPGSVSGLPTSEPSITLNSNDTAVEVFSAGVDCGMGQWTSSWASGNTTLTIVQDTAFVGTHTATLSWSLYDAP